MGVKKKSKKSKSSKKSVASKVKSAVAGLTGTSKSTGARHKKSALWYLKQIQRLKAKRRYEKEKMRL